MDGSADVGCSGTCLTQPQFRFVDNSKGVLDPYLKLSTQYGFANFMFQTNQGPSFPAHQFIFGSTSAPSASNRRVCGTPAVGLPSCHTGTCSCSLWAS